MDKLNAVLSGACLVALVVAGHALVANAALERRANSADSLAAALRATDSSRAIAFDRERDSTSRVIAYTRSRLRPVRRDSLPASADTVYLKAPVDSAIGALTAAREQDSLQLLFWRSQVRAYQDTVVPALVRAREGWEAKAKRPRYTVTDIAGGIALGWAVAKDNTDGLKVGGALILLPRAIHAAKELLSWAL